MDAKSLVNCISIMPANRSILIRGPHGIGKSEIVASIAKKKGLPVIDVRASTMSEGDVVGFPNLDAIKKSGVATFALPSWYMAACKAPCVLFLDELNRGLIGVLNGMLQIVLDRQLGSDVSGKPVPLHKDTIVVAAVNWGTDYTITEMDPALLSRFWIADFSPSDEDWIDWAQNTGGIDPLIIDFIKTHPAHLREKKAVDPSRVSPNQRAWAMLDSVIKHNGVSLYEPDTYKSLSIDTLYSIATGFIGFETGSAFHSYVKDHAKMLNASDILDNWTTSKKRVSALSAEKILDLCSKIRDFAGKNDLTEDQCKNLVHFHKSISGEQNFHLFKLIMNLDKTPVMEPYTSAVSADIVRAVEKARQLSKP